MAASSALYKKLTLLRWTLPAIGFLFVFGYEAIEHALSPDHFLDMAHAMSNGHLSPFFLVGTFAFGVIGPVALWFVLSWVAGQVAQKEAAEGRFVQAYQELQESNVRLTTLNQISESIASATSLDELLDIVVRLPSLVTRIGSCSILLADEATGKLSQAKSFGVEPEDGEDSGPPHLSLVLNAGERVIGVLNINLLPSYSPTESEMKLLHTVANEVASAIETARLRAQHLLTLYEVDKTIRAEPNLTRLLEQILAKLINTCHADCGAILLYEDGPKHLALNSVRRCSRPNCQACSGGDDCIGVLAVKSGQPCLISDVGQETSWRGLASPETVRSILCVPLVTGENALGLAVLGHPLPAMFSKSQLNLLSAVASQAALALRNAQLYIGSEELAIAEERSRIARDIHDGVAQSLAFLRLKIELCKAILDDPARLEMELDAVRKTLAENIEELRRAIYALRPLDLERLGFLPALHRFIQEFGEQNQLHIDFRVQGEVKRLSSKYEPVLFRMVQEALANVAKHAQAENVWIELDFSSPEAMVKMSLQDDGRGFDPGRRAEPSSLKGRMGLFQMREQVEALRGTFSVQSAEGRGTSITATLPAE